MFVFILKRVCPANTGSPPTARPECLWDTALSRAHSNACLLILSSIKVCHKEIASSLPSSTISLDLPFWYPSYRKTARTIVRHLMERVFSVFCPPETLHSYQGKEFENELAKELHSVLGHKNTSTAAFRPQSNCVLKSVDSTVHHMLAMYTNLSFDNWAELLPFVQFAHNAAYSTTPQETPHCLMFRRAAVLPADLILVVPSTFAPRTQLDYSKQTVENMQLAYELPRRNLRERADKQAVVNETL